MINEENTFEKEDARNETEIVPDNVNVSYGKEEIGSEEKKEQILNAGTNGQNCIDSDENIELKVEENIEMVKVVNNDVDPPGDVENEDIDNEYEGTNHESLDEDDDENVKFNAGDTLLQSKPFAFVIHATHR